MSMTYFFVAFRAFTAHYLNTSQPLGLQAALASVLSLQRKKRHKPGAGPHPLSRLSFLQGNVKTDLTVEQFVATPLPDLLTHTAY